MASSGNQRGRMEWFHRRNKRLEVGRLEVLLLRWRGLSGNLFTFSLSPPPFFLKSVLRWTVFLLFSRSVVSDSATPWTAACWASLSFTSSWSLFKLMSIELLMPSSHLILCHPLLLPSIFPSFRVFSNESAHHIRWPKN